MNAAESKRICERKLIAIDGEAREKLFRLSRFDDEWWGQVSRFGDEMSQVSGSSSNRENINGAKVAVNMFAKCFFIADEKCYVTKVDFYAVYMAVLPGESYFSLYT